MRNESIMPAETPFLSAKSHGLLYNARILLHMYANWTSETVLDENLAHNVICYKFVTSHMYSTELSPPTPSEMSPEARYVLFG